LSFHDFVVSGFTDLNLLVLSKFTGTKKNEEIPGEKISSRAVNVSSRKYFV
jgi:hypothetical protein